MKYRVNKEFIRLSIEDRHCWIINWTKKLFDYQVDTDTIGLLRAQWNP